MPKLYSMLILAASLFLGCVAIGFGESDKCNGENYASVDQICEDDVLKNTCGAVYYNPQSQKCENGILFSKCGDNFYNPQNQDCCKNRIFTSASQKCEDGILLNKCGDEWYNVFLKYCEDEVVKDNKDNELFDIRDGKTYKYVIIGAQAWMAENLRYEISNTKCYDDEPDNCDVFGVLYDWNTANNICPVGWHLPDDSEWNELIDFIEYTSGCNFCAGTKLKSLSGYKDDGNGTDDFGFNALPGGFYRNDIIINYGFMEKGEVSVFWSATKGYMDGSAHIHFVKYNKTNLDYTGLYYNTSGSSWAAVRCVKD